jgi:hypothetical protein
MGQPEESGLCYYAAWCCRFVSVDPLAAKYPFYTPYQYAGNQPVISVDIDGLEGDKPNNLQKVKRDDPEEKDVITPGEKYTDPPKAKLNIFVTMCKERIDCLEDRQGEPLVPGYRSAKLAEEQTNTLNAAILEGNPDAMGNLTFFRVLEVADRDDLIVQLENLISTGRYELGNIINDGHGNYADIQIGGGWSGNPAANPPQDVLNEKTMLNEGDREYAERFRALAGPETAVYILNCSVGGGEKPDVASAFMKILSRHLGTPVIASMGPTSSSRDLFFGDTVSTNPLYLISEDYYTLEELRETPTKFMGIGIWKRALPNGNLEMVHPPIFSPNGEVSFNHQSSFDAAARAYLKIIR